MQLGAHVHMHINIEIIDIAEDAMQIHHEHTFFVDVQNEVKPRDGSMKKHMKKGSYSLSHLPLNGRMGEAPHETGRICVASTWGGSMSRHIPRRM